MFKVSETELQQQLVLLRDLFRLTGALHDAQQVQLRYLPRVCIGHSTHTEVHIKFTPGDIKKPRVVTIKAQVEGREPKHLKKALAKMDQTIKFLLGEDFDVVIEYGSKRWKSPGKKPTNGNRPHDPGDERPVRVP